MREIITPWAKLQFPDTWPPDHEKEIWNEITVPKGGTAIDIGAHYGLYTTKMAREAGPEGTVLAFEPCTANREILTSNIRRNGLKVIISSCAISDYAGTGTLFDYTGVELAESESGKHFLRGAHSGQAFEADYLKNTPASQPWKDTKVLVTTLDRAVEANHLQCVDLIKMDVEGAEVKVLQGGALTLEKHRAKIVIEVHFNQEEALKDLLKKYGYVLANYYPKVTFTCNPIAVFQKVVPG